MSEENLAYHVDLEYLDGRIETYEVESQYNISVVDSKLVLSVKSDKPYSNMEVVVLESALVGWTTYQIEQAPKLVNVVTNI